MRHPCSTATGGGVDYTWPRHGHFNPGDPSPIYRHSLVNDVLDEADETVVVTLTNPVNATWGPQPTTPT